VFMYKVFKEIIAKAGVHVKGFMENIAKAGV
jgi:hypothetical protein